MKKVLLSLLSLMTAAVLWTGCQEENVAPSSDAASKLKGNVSARLSGEMCGSSNYDLIAGQHNDAGFVTVSNDDVNLYVTYITQDSSLLKEVHLWAGTDTTLVTFHGGRPVPGQMPYKFSSINDTTFTVTIPLNAIPYLNGCGKEIRIFAHAALSSGETAWGGNFGSGINVSSGPAWYYAIDYTVACCTENPPSPSTKLGTAFAYGTHVFTTDPKSNPDKLKSLNLTKNRWGWAVNVKAAGTTTHNLWVGAGLNVTKKAKLVGTVTISYNGNQATVTYNLNSGYSIEEAHVYAGDFTPTTLAPGQYGNTANFNPFATTHSVTVDVTDTNGDGIWVIAHAVAYGSGVTNP